MSEHPIESCYVRTFSSLQRPDADVGVTKALCIGLAHQVDELQSALSYTTNLVERQANQLTRLLSENRRLRELQEDGKT